MAGSVAEFRRARDTDGDQHISLIFAAGLCPVNLGGVHRVSVCPVHARARLSDLTDPIAWLALRTFLIIGIAIVRFKKTE